MKTINSILLMIVAVILLSSFASALNVTIGTINTPTSGSNAIKGTYNFSVTYNSTTLQNITVLAGSTVICSSTVVTNDQTLQNATCTYDTTGSTDGTFTITFGFWMLNGSNDGNTSATSIVIDNTAPTATVTVDFDKVEPLKLFVSDCSRSTDNLGTSLNYTQNLTKPSGVINNDTTSTGIATWSETEIDEKGEYTLTCQVVDAGNNFATQTATIRVADKGVPSVALGPQVRGTPQNNFFFFGGIALVVVALGVLALIVLMQTSKKRR